MVIFTLGYAYFFEGRLQPNPKSLTRHVKCRLQTNLQQCCFPCLTRIGLTTGSANMEKPVSILIKDSHACISFILVSASLGILANFENLMLCLRMLESANIVKIARHCISWARSLELTLNLNRRIRIMCAKWKFSPYLHFPALQVIQQMFFFVFAALVGPTLVLH